MYLSIIFIPLFAATICNRWLGIKYGPILSIFLIFIGLVLVLLSIYEIIFNCTSLTLFLGTWFQSFGFKIEWSILFDSVTLSILFPIYLISFLVQVYSYSYMGQDPHILRFISYLSLFTFFMLLLVSADNLLFLFLGWEGVGLISYLLINFWFTRVLANNSALKAFYINRIGDLSFQLGII